MEGASTKKSTSFETLVIQNITNLNELKAKLNDIIKTGKDYDYDVSTCLKSLIVSSDHEIMLLSIKAISELAKCEEKREIYGTKAIISPIINVLKKEPTTENAEVMKQSCRALGNLCADCDKSREILLENDIVPILSKLLKKAIDLKLHELKLLVIKILINFGIGGKKFSDPVFNSGTIDQIQHILSLELKKEDFDDNTISSCLSLLGVIIDNNPEVLYRGKLNSIVLNILKETTNIEISELCLEHLHAQAENATPGTTTNSSQRSLFTAVLFSQVNFKMQTSFLLTFQKVPPFFEKFNVIMCHILIKNKRRKLEEKLRTAGAFFFQLNLILLINMSDKKRRGPKFKEDERYKLVKLIASQQAIIMNKNTDFETKQAKSKAWADLTNLFNTTGNIFRTKGSLVRLWDKLKSDCKVYHKKRYASVIGGEVGPAFITIPLFEDIWTMLSRNSSRETVTKKNKKSGKTVSKQVVPKIEVKVENNSDYSTDDQMLIIDDEVQTEDDRNSKISQEIYGINFHDFQQPVQEIQKPTTPLLFKNPYRTLPNIDKPDSVYLNTNYNDADTNLTIQQMEIQLLQKELVYKRKLYDLKLQAAAKELQIKTEINKMKCQLALLQQDWTI